MSTHTAAQHHASTDRPEPEAQRFSVVPVRAWCFLLMVAR